MNLDDDHSNLCMPRTKPSIWKLFFQLLHEEIILMLYCYSRHDYLEPLGIFLCGAAHHRC